MADRGTANRSKSANKKRQPRQKRKSEEPADPGCSATVNSEAGESGLTLEESFERELLWCIQQIEAGLATSKADSKQVQDSLKLLKTLQNPKAPLVKKRQVMRMAFGDYRKKMQEEEKKFAASAKKVCLKPATQKHSQKSSTFLKKSQLVSGKKQTTNSPVHTVMEDTGAGFTFGFQINTENHDNAENHEVNLSKDNENTDPERTTTDCSAQINYFKMVPSEQNFSFNFSLESLEKGHSPGTAVTPIGGKDESGTAVTSIGSKGDDSVHRVLTGKTEEEIDKQDVVHTVNSGSLTAAADNNSIKMAALEISGSS